jgi:hypothetical protein
MFGRLGLALIVTMQVAAVAVAEPQGRGRGRGSQGPPEIVGKWTGTWSAFNPAQVSPQPKEVCKKLDADVAKSEAGWVATFEGDCGRPYTYKISMDGRLAGDVVLFKGTVDLGPKDGGVFDWVGRATGDEFIGFYTSAYSTGFFNLTRVK